MGANPLCDLHPHAIQRVQRGERVLEDHRQLVAAQRAHTPLGQRQQIDALEHDPPGDARPLGAGQPDRAQRAHALARARLAHDPKRAAVGNLEGDAVHGVHHPAFGGELHVQVLDLQQRPTRRDHPVTLPSGKRYRQLT